MDWSKENELTLLLGTAAILSLVVFIILVVVVCQHRLYTKQHDIHALEMKSQRELMEAVILTKEKEQNAWHRNYTMVLAQH